MILHPGSAPGDHPPPPEVVLQPGEWHFAREPALLTTLLGSCVAIVLWHPQRGWGGMCHYLLPGRAPGRSGGDPRYSDDAFAALLGAARAPGTAPGELTAKIFGGGDMFEGTLSSDRGTVGQQNITTARRLLAEHGLVGAAESVGGSAYRHIRFETWSGDVWVKRVEASGARRP